MFRTRMIAALSAALLFVHAAPVAAQPVIDARVLPTQSPNARTQATNIISSGAITPSYASIAIAAESGTTDDLATVVVSGWKVGATIKIIADAGDTITLKHGTGNITTDTGGDVILTDGAYFELDVTASGVTLRRGGGGGSGAGYNFSEFGGSSGIADNAAALTAACTRINADGGGKLIVPPGRFSVGSQVACEFSDDGEHVYIEGSGEGVSTFYFNGATTGGFDFTLDNDNGLGTNQRLTISDLTIESGEARSGHDGIEVDGGTDVGVDPTLNPSVRIRNVTIKGEASGDYWRACVNASAANGVHIEQLTCNGSRPSSYDPDNLLGKGVVLTESGDHFIVNSRFYELDTGIEISGTTEGVYIQIPAMVSVNNGISWIADAYPEPLLSVKGGHINAYKRPIKAVNVVQGSIEGTLLYWLGDTVGSGTTDESWVAIELTNADDFGIVDNTISTSGQSAGTEIAQFGVVVTNGKRINTIGNRFLSGSNYGNGAAVQYYDTQGGSIVANIIEGWKSGIATTDFDSDGVDLTAGIAVANNVLSGLSDIGVSMNACQNCYIGGNIGTGAAPTLGWWGTAAESGNHAILTVGENQWDDSAITLFDAAGTYNFAGKTPWADVASASSLNLAGARSNNIRITGTTGITALGTAASGVTKHLRFADAVAITHNGTSLILPGAQNITAAAGATATVVSLGSGNWVMTEYQLAGGVVEGDYTPTATTETNLDSVTTYSTGYMRIGNKVTVFGRADIDATAGGAIQFGLSLPIASNFTDTGDAAGFVSEDANGNVGKVLGDITNDRAQFNMVATGTSARGVWFNFSYRVK